MNHPWVELHSRTRGISSGGLIFFTRAHSFCRFSVRQLTNMSMMTVPVKQPVARNQICTEERPWDPHHVYREYSRKCSLQRSQLSFPYFYITCYIFTRGKLFSYYDAWHLVCNCFSCVIKSFDAPFVVLCKFVARIEAISANTLPLTHWGRDKMDTISQTTFSNAFSWMKMFEYWLKFHWNLFLMVQLTIFQHWFR